MKTELLYIRNRAGPSTSMCSTTVKHVQVKCMTILQDIQHKYFTVSSVKIYSELSTITRLLILLINSFCQSTLLLFISVLLHNFAASTNSP